MTHPRDHERKRGKKDPTEREQVFAFEQQLELAKKLDKPLVIHVREAAEKAFEVMEKVGRFEDVAAICNQTSVASFCSIQSELPRNKPIHMHCFSDGWDLCERWMKAWPAMKFGFVPDYFSREVVAKIPEEKLLLETDSPYFKPRAVSLDTGQGCRLDQFFMLLHAVFDYILKNLGADWF